MSPKAQLAAIRLLQRWRVYSEDFVSTLQPNGVKLRDDTDRFLALASDAEVAAPEPKKGETKDEAKK